MRRYIIYLGSSGGARLTLPHLSFIPMAAIKAPIPSLMWCIASRHQLSQLLRRLSFSLTPPICLSLSPSQNATSRSPLPSPYTPLSEPSPYRLRRAVPPSYPENSSLSTSAPDTLPALMPTLSKNPLDARWGGAASAPERQAGLPPNGITLFSGMDFLFGRR